MMRQFHFIMMYFVLAFTFITWEPIEAKYKLTVEPDRAGAFPGV